MMGWEGMGECEPRAAEKRRERVVSASYQLQFDM
jgi:hypothetical protein